jgi:hypothetical protein
MGTYLRGALVEFMPTMLIPIPNVIVFQYNPETMTHTWTQPQAVQAAAGAMPGNPLAVTGSPGEAFGFTLAMDAQEDIADGTAGSGLAQVSGIYSRLAALEMLIHPSSSTTSSGLLGMATAALSSALSGGGGSKPPRTVPANTLPVVLFVWGPGRIVPVRVTSLTITEQRYDTLLNPIHAEAQLGLQVLTPQDLAATSDTLTTVAKVAYQYTLSLRQALAIANLVNAADSIVGMLPH